LRSLINPGS